MKKIDTKNLKKFNWPLVGLFLFAFMAFLGSLAIMLNVAPTVFRINNEPILIQEEKDEHAFLWKEMEYSLPVVIDNMKDAWPPEGLEYARVVFEAPVEAGITRFLAIFGSDEKTDFKIGPVRSARPYFVDWAEEFRTLLAHAGGSDAALTQLKNSDIFDLDEFRYGGKYFNRAHDRFAPHNTFTSIDLLRQFYDKASLRGMKRGGLDIKSGSPDTMIGIPHQPYRDRSEYRDNLSALNFNKWNTKDDALYHGTVTKITIPYKEPYTVRWEYRAPGNKYLRFVNDKPFLTASGEQIDTKNIVVMKTQITIIDNVSRRKIITDGGGDALIFQDGKVIKGSWKKAKGSTKFYDETVSEISFNRGPVWVEVVSANTDIVF